MWMTLSGLPLNFFHELILRSIGGGYGWFLKRDNANACLTHLKVARICIEINVSKPLCHSFWLGTSRLENGHY